ncbi:MAG: efflux RND transporter periplasmic adaptor subunit [Caldilineaceae bacterium]
MRRLLIALAVIVVLAIGGWYGYQNYYQPAKAQEQAPSYETVKVGRGSIQATVNATGSIEPESEVSLAFRSAGRVSTVLVTAGQAVSKGQLLAELETTDLTLALAQSKVNLEISQSQLEKLETPADARDVLAAQAAVEVAQANVAGAEAQLASAQANYRQIFIIDPITENQRKLNEAGLRQAEINLRVAQRAYDEVKTLPNVGMLPQSQQLESATIAYENAKAQAAVTDENQEKKAPNQAQVAQAQAQIAQGEVSLRQAQSGLVQAQNSLSKLLEGPKQVDLNIARAQVRQAQLNQLQAENSLNNARLVASFDGVVSTVNVKQGELTSGALPAVVLSDLGNFHMTVLVDEIDVRQVQVGQTVELSLDALPDYNLTGKVTKVAPTAQEVSGVIAYEVTIVPDPTDAPLRAGMSATAIIVTARVDNVVLLANRFIQLNRETGQAFVSKMVSGQPVLQEVTLGLRNERESQILAGLNDNDEVALVTTTSQDQLRNALFGGGGN